MNKSFDDAGGFSSNCRNCEDSLVEINKVTFWSVTLCPIVMPMSSILQGHIDKLGKVCFQNWHSVCKLDQNIC